LLDCTIFLNIFHFIY